MKNKKEPLTKVCLVLILGSMLIGILLRLMMDNGLTILGIALLVGIIFFLVAKISAEYSIEDALFVGFCIFLGIVMGAAIVVSISSGLYELVW